MYFDLKTSSTTTRVIVTCDIYSKVCDDKNESNTLLRQRQAQSEHSRSFGW